MKYDTLGAADPARTQATTGSFSETRCVGLCAAQVFASTSNVSGAK